MCIHIVYTLGIHTDVYCCLSFFSSGRLGPNVLGGGGKNSLYYISSAIALIDIECSYSHVLIIYYTLNCIHSTNEMKQIL